MRKIERIIVSALIFSKDNKILMGKKDSAQGGVYSDCWHIPGGGVDEGETFEQALKREVREEIGFDISPYKIIAIPYKDTGITEKTLKDTDERVLCRMEFNRFRIDIEDKLASEIELHPSGDLIETRWFSVDELANIKQAAGGKEFFQKIGLIQKD